MIWKPSSVIRERKWFFKVSINNYYARKEWSWKQSTTIKRSLVGRKAAPEKYKCKTSQKTMPANIIQTGNRFEPLRVED